MAAKLILDGGSSVQIEPNSVQYTEGEPGEVIVAMSVDRVMDQLIRELAMTAPERRFRPDAPVARALIRAILTEIRDVYEEAEQLAEALADEHGTS